MAVLPRPNYRIGKSASGWCLASYNFMMKDAMYGREIKRLRSRRAPWIAEELDVARCGQTCSDQLVHDVVTGEETYVIADVEPLVRSRRFDFRTRRAFGCLFTYLCALNDLKDLLDEEVVDRVGEAFDYGPDGLVAFEASLPLLGHDLEERGWIELVIELALAFYDVCPQPRRREILALVHQCRRRLPRPAAQVRYCRDHRDADAERGPPLHLQIDDAGDPEPPETLTVQGFMEAMAA